MPVVNYNNQNTQTFRGKGYVFKFLPGANEVRAKIWEQLQENGSVQNFMSQGKIVPVMVRAPKADSNGPGKLQKVGDESVKEKSLDSLKEADIAAMDAWAAVSLVEGVIDLGHLRRFNEQEESRKGGGRKTVLEALRKQIEAMVITEPENKD